MVTYAIALTVLGLAVVLLSQIFAKNTGTRKNLLKIFGVIGVIGILGLLIPSISILQGALPLSLGALSAGTSESGATSISSYQPTASYSALDKFANTVVTGTSYYKIGNNKATTTAYTTPALGDKLQYWVDNSTAKYWVQPATVSVNGQNTIVQAVAFQNGTLSLTGYDLVSRASVSSSASNSSMSANKQANIEFTLQGTAKKSSAPFGGIFVVEYNNSISSVTCTGDDLLSSNPYHLTYGVTATTHTYKAYAFGATLDDGTAGVKKITCQFNNGASDAGAGSAYYAKVIPANYYVAIDGTIQLDTEKFADSSNTRTGTTYNAPSATFYWS